MTSQLVSLNLLAASEYWQISVGQTKVKSRGQKKRTIYLPRKGMRLREKDTLEVRELNFLEAVPPGHGLEKGGWLSNLGYFSH